MGLMRSVVSHQRLKRRNRHTVLLLCCSGFIIIFVVYTLAVVAHGTALAISEYNEMKAQNKFEYFEYQQDEITRILGGPDKDYVVAARVSGQRDFASMERSLTRLLRMRRLMSIDDGEDTGAAMDGDGRSARVKRAADGKQCPTERKLRFQK